MHRPFLAVTLAGAFALAACLGAPSADPFRTTLQGTWATCATDGTTDVAERLTFADDALEWTVSTHASSDGSCGGAETVASRFSGAFSIGEFLDATLAGATVLARGLDATDATRTFYTTVYVDEAATPRTLYLGAPDPALGRDMSSGAKRPIVLGPKPLPQR